MATSKRVKPICQARMLRGEEEEELPDLSCSGAAYLWEEGEVEAIPIVSAELLLLLLLLLLFKEPRSIAE